MTMDAARTDLPKVLGVPQYGYARPLWLGLRSRPEFSFVEDVPAQLAIKLRGRALTAALLSPIDYARDYAMYRIAPGAGISSNRHSRTVLLYFNKGLKEVRTIAASPASSSEIVLAEIIFAEVFNLRPAIVPMYGSCNEMLQKADAALVIDSESLLAGEDVEALDLVDEWSDISGLPYVHHIWVCREGDLATGEMRLLAEGARQWKTRLDEVRENRDKEAIEAYFERFSFALANDALDGLMEFLRMAYYHGILEDVPDVKVHRLE